MSLSDFNYTTTTTTLRPTTTTTTEQMEVQLEIEGDETTWIVIGCTIGAVGILALVAIGFIFVREKKDDEKTFFS